MLETHSSRFALDDFSEVAFLVLGFWTEDPSEAFSESCAFGVSYWRAFL